MKKAHAPSQLRGAWTNLEVALARWPASRLLVLGLGLALGVSLFLAPANPPAPIRAQSGPTATPALVPTPTPEVLPTDSPITSVLLGRTLEEVRKEAEEAIARAERTTDAANRAVDMVNTILQFLQVAGLIIGVLLALIASAGIKTIFDYRTNLDKARDEMNNMRDLLKAEMDEAASTLKTFESRLEAELATVRAQGNQAIRALALFDMGKQQMEAKNMKAALKTFNESYKLDPDNRATNYFLGEIYIQQRELTKGIEHLGRAKLGGEYPPADAALAVALRLRGDQETDPIERSRYYAQGEDLFLHALKTDPALTDIYGESVYGSLGGLYRRQGRIEDAIRAYEQAERTTPNNSYPINNLAMLHAMNGATQAAQGYFMRAIAMSQRMLETNPTDYWARFDLVTAQMALGEADKALDQFRLALPEIHTVGPLDTLMNGMNILRTTPAPPEGIERLISEIEAAIEKVKKRSQGKVDAPEARPTPH